MPGFWLNDEECLAAYHLPLRSTLKLAPKPDGMLTHTIKVVNTSRGALIQEKALIAALESGRLGGVGLDVFEIEPLPMDHPLRRFENAILLSHRGYATVDILTARYQEAIKNILDFMDGKALPLLNPEVKRER